MSNVTPKKPRGPVLDADSKKPYVAAYSNSSEGLVTNGRIAADVTVHALQTGARVNVGDYVVEVVQSPADAPTGSSRRQGLRERLFERLALMPQLFGQEHAAGHNRRSSETADAEVLEELLIDSAVNMELSIIALGSALESVGGPVSPQLARSVQATENVWRDMESEFGLLTSTEVSQAVGSKSPNRSYASDQRAAGRLLAIKRSGAYRYPGFQIDRLEHRIRPVMADLLLAANEAGRSEASLALWMTVPTGYLDGARPVDQLARPEKVVEAARQSFNIQW
ncbi:hypothetical protein [Pseudarthrobacter sp. H2]|uniref:hypothetical protein n=1 Tax=Pseudarthrobacter sp. H2 TaxID=3418415 RepID=UPI003CF5083E